jgi:hypothetical protein
MQHHVSHHSYSVSWFRSYVINRQSRIPASGTLSLPFEVISGVPQGSVLGPLLCGVIIIDLCNSTIVHFSTLLMISKFSELQTHPMIVSYFNLISIP